MLRTIVSLVVSPVSINVLIAGVSFSVSICVLSIVVNIRTQVTDVPDLVSVPISLVWVVVVWTVVVFVFLPIIVVVIVASITFSVLVSILLPRVWNTWTIVGSAPFCIASSYNCKPSRSQLVNAAQVVVRVAVQVSVASALLS